MYSENLEKLIKSVIADGEISEKERAVLHKKAEAEGIDVDELDVYVDGLIAQQISAALKPVAPTVPKGPTKQGTITKCPNCGAPVEPMAVKCSMCDYEFRNVEALKSSQILSEKLEAVGNAYRDKKDSLDKNYYMQKEQATIIRNFPVPTAKEDLLDFCITMRARWNSITNLEQTLRAPFKSKYDECVSKCKLLFPNDPMFQGIYEQYEKDKKKVKLGPFQIYGLCMIGLLLSLFLLIKCA